MTDIQGALGSAQMDRAAEIVAERQRLARIYDQAFADLDWLRTPACPEGYSMVTKVIHACLGPMILVK